MSKIIDPTSDYCGEDSMTTKNNDFNSISLVYFNKNKIPFLAGGRDISLVRFIEQDEHTTGHGKVADHFPRSFVIDEPNVMNKVSSRSCWDNKNIESDPIRSNAGINFRYLHTTESHPTKHELSQLQDLFKVFFFLRSWGSKKQETYPFFLKIGPAKSFVSTQRPKKRGH